MDPPKNPSSFHPRDSAAADLSLQLGLATPQYPQLNSLQFDGQWVAAWLQIDRPQQSPANSDSSVNQPRETQLSSNTSSDIFQFQKLLRKVTYNVGSSDTQSFSSPMRKAKEDVTTVPKFKRPRQSPEVETEAEGSSQRRLLVDSPLKALWEHFNIRNLPEEKLKKAFLLDAEFDYCDAEIIVEGTTVGVNRIILASRSPFFHELFKKTNVGSANGSKPKYVMTELVPQGKIGYETFMVFLNCVYTGKLKPSPPEVSTCVDESCAHNACVPAINYAVELMYASATFQMKELVLAVQRRLFNFVDKALVEDVIPIVIVAFHCHQNLLLHTVFREWHAQI